METRWRAAERTAPQRRRTAEAADVRLQARLVELGFADDLPGYLRDGYGRRRLPVLALARELGIGNGRIKREVDAAGVVRRRPGGAESARARWDRVRSAGVSADPSPGPGVPAGQQTPVHR